MYTKEEIRNKMNESLKWLEHGIVAIYRFQTDYEKDVEETRVTNHVGFNKGDAPYLTYLARWILSGKSLSGNHVAKARQRMNKYAGQLAELANKSKRFATQ